MYAWLADSLSRSEIVLCASRRLARQLREHHDTMQMEAGLRAWPTPGIFFIGDWLNDVLENADSAAVPLRIDARASALLWERCAADRSFAQLPGLNGLLRQFRQTWSRLHEWRVPLKTVFELASGPEQRQFASAASRYSELLETHNWIDDALVAGSVSRAINDAVIEVPARLAWAGFDRFSPSLMQLIDTLSNAGTDSRYIESTAEPVSLSLAELPDLQGELRAAGAWARRALQDDSKLKVAVVCPGLETDATRITRLVREGFAPGWQYGGAAHRQSVNVSYGRTLSEFPVISVAIALLRWVRTGLTSREVSTLLRSRSILGGSLAGRCRLEQRLRRLPDRQWRPAELLAALAGEPLAEDAAQWLRHMQYIAEATATLGHIDSPSAHAGQIDALLAAAGWPGPDSQDSNAFQLLNRWRELLNEFARLDRVLAEMSFDDALSRLGELATDTIFQPQAEAGVIPLLGMLEAAGMQFDKIWICGFDAMRWPPAGNPLTYVSRKLQLDHEMPDASARDTLEFSRRVLRRLIGSANEVVLSWARSEDGVDAQLSPLVGDLSGLRSVTAADPGWHAKSMLDNADLAAPDGDPVPGVADDEQVRGGAYTVQRQASNPFSGFAYGRLGVADLQAIQPGLSASLRGSIIHQALARLYAELPSQRAISAWSESEVRERIQRAIDESLKYILWQADPVLRRIVALERVRLNTLLLQFIDAELQREGFELSCVERKLVYSSNGTSLDLRVDRIDRLADGRALVIDYKTGSEKSLTNRQGEINDLQLVVYALAYADPVGGVSIVNVDSRKISYKSSVSGDEWTAVFAQWAKVAEAAMRGLAQGDARINIAMNTVNSRSINVLGRVEELRRGR